MSFLKGLFGKKKTTERITKPDAPQAPAPPPPPPDFPLGENIISDPDIRTFVDLGRHYPLPSGFVYVQDEGQPPAIVRSRDGRRYSFLIEEGLLTFNDPYTREDGRTGYKTTEVFKRGLR
jgi:hypothetical protein